VFFLKNSFKVVATSKKAAEKVPDAASPFWYVTLTAFGKILTYREFIESRYIFIRQFISFLTFCTCLRLYITSACMLFEHGPEKVVVWGLPQP
jgi:hypothetical protein